jgi:hypothetical protein
MNLGDTFEVLTQVFSVWRFALWAEETFFQGYLRTLLWSWWVRWCPPSVRDKTLEGGLPGVMPRDSERFGR